MRDYSTARTIFSILEFVAWTAVVIGVIVAVTGAGAAGRYGGGGAGLVAAVPGLILSVVGLIAAATVQFYRAGVDTAQMTGKMLKIAEEQLQVSKAAADYSGPIGSSKSAGMAAGVGTKSFASTPEQRDAVASRSEVAPGVSQDQPATGIDHKGVAISVSQLGVFVGEERFETVEAAKKSVDDKAATQETSQSYIDRRAAEMMRKYPVA